MRSRFSGLLCFVALGCSTGFEVQVLDEYEQSLTSVCVDMVADSVEERTVGLRDRPRIEHDEAVLIEATVADEICISGQDVSFDYIAIWAGDRAIQGLRL